MPGAVLGAPSDLLTRNLDETGWPLLAPTLLTVHRMAELDEMSRQIVYALDGVRLGELLFGQTHTWEIPPGPHTLRVHNTLVWQTHTFEAEPGGHVHFTVWNRAWGGYYVMMLFLGAAPLRLGVARGQPFEIPADIYTRRHKQKVAPPSRGEPVNQTGGAATVIRVWRAGRDGSRTRGDR